MMSEKRLMRCNTCVYVCARYQMQKTNCQTGNTMAKIAVSKQLKSVYKLLTRITFRSVVACCVCSTKSQFSMHLVYVMIVIGKSRHSISVYLFSFLPHRTVAQFTKAFCHDHVTMSFRCFNQKTNSH